MNPIEVYFQCKRIYELDERRAFYSKHVQIEYFSTGLRLAIWTPDGFMTVMEDTEVTRPGRWQETISEYLKNIEEALVLKVRETSSWKSRDPIPPELDVAIPVYSMIEKYQKVTDEDWLELALMLMPTAFEELNQYKILHKVPKLTKEFAHTKRFFLGGNETYLLADYGKVGICSSNPNAEGKFRIIVGSIDRSMAFRILEGLDD